MATVSVSYSLPASLTYRPSARLPQLARPINAAASLAFLSSSFSPPPPSKMALSISLAAVGFLATTALASHAVSAAEIEAGKSVVDEALALTAQEPKNALSLPTWTIHVASVVEWVAAMALVWKYGDTPRNAAWKGLSWGMVPLLGGAMCACTWHFFYNAESLEVLVALQAALTMIGNFTMWLAAFRIYQSYQDGSKAS